MGKQKDMNLYINKANNCDAKYKYFTLRQKITDV